jgi:chaperonin GroEL (HSP60 family)
VNHWYTKLVNGIVIDKEIVHSGMPKRVENAKIALIDASLENDKPEIDSKLTSKTQLKSLHF